MSANHAAQPTGLETLARARFATLSAAESKLLRAAAKGEIAYCGPSQKDDDPGNDPSRGEKWPAAREIRSELIRWLFVDRNAKANVDPLGIRAHGAKITGSLDLSFVNVPFSLALLHCRVMEDLILRGAEIAQLELEGSRVKSILADNVKVHATVFLTDGFHSEGRVWFMNARIEGTVDCAGSTFRNPPRAGDATSGIAVDLEAAMLSNSVFLRNGFRCEGQVNLIGAQIGGDLDCDGATLVNPFQQGVERSGKALLAEHAVIQGNVLLRGGASAEGDLTFLGAQVAGDIECRGLSLDGALDAERAVIKGTLFWHGVSSPAQMQLSLINATAGSYEDDELSWPRRGNLSLDGFVYGRITRERSSVEDRLRWLGRLNSFTPQPYQQLAKVLKDEGNDDGAREVLVELARRELSASFVGDALRLPWSAIGYGYYPLRAMEGLVVLTGLGWILYRRAYLQNKMTPTDKEAYQEYKKNGRPQPHYRRFSPFIYSLENSLPLVKLGQADSWQPDPTPAGAAIDSASRWARIKHWLGTPTPLRWFLWAQILLGWILATVFVAGVTGLVH